MAHRKHPYGSEHRTWLKYHWAFAIDANNGCVLVRCETTLDAVYEKDMLKHSDAVRVSHTIRKVSEMELTKAIRKNGWKLLAVRDQGKFFPRPVDEFIEPEVINLDEVLV